MKKNSQQNNNESNDLIDYSVYKMSKFEKLGYFLLVFVVGAFVGYLFYGGIGKDVDGNPTTLTYVLNVLIPTITGVIAAKIFLPIRKQQIIEKRKRSLHLQFRDFIESVATSLNAGKNVPDSIKNAYDDLKVQYAEGSFILRELEWILSNMNNNVNLEDLLLDFGQRSGINDIESFGSVFETCYRKGGNIKDVIKTTHQIIGDKIEIEMEIETMVTANKTEQYIMIAMPIGLVALIKMMSPEFAANFASATGIIATTIAIAIFIVAYFVGREVLSIKKV